MGEWGVGEEGGGEEIDTRMGNMGDHTAWSYRHFSAGLTITCPAGRR